MCVRVCVCALSSCVYRVHVTGSGWGKGVGGGSQQYIDQEQAWRAQSSWHYIKQSVILN